VALTDEEVELLARVRKKLGGPEEESSRSAIDLTASSEVAEVSVEH